MLVEQYLQESVNLRPVGSRSKRDLAQQRVKMSYVSFLFSCPEKKPNLEKCFVHREMRSGRVHEGTLKLYVG